MGKNNKKYLIDERFINSTVSIFNLNGGTIEIILTDQTTAKDLEMLYIMNHPAISQISVETEK